MSRTTVLVSQLNATLRLTNTELMIAETRRAQAATPAVERELAENADHCRERMDLIVQAIRDLGGVPDALGAAVGRVGATVKTAIEQGQDLDEALLGDLALEHQLLDRADFIHMLASALDEPAVAGVAARLQAAHRETVEWLLTRLAEVAVGGPVALRPTPAQVAAGWGRRIGQFPARQAVGAINRSVQVVQRVRGRAGAIATSQVARSRQAVGDAADVVRAGRDASLRRSEEIAEARGDDERAAALHDARRELGALDAADLPIRGYDSLNARAAVDRIGRLREPGDVRAVLAYEQANKGRRTVVDAAERQLETMAGDLATAS